MSGFIELNCGECGCIIGYYKSSGAPHYHYYYCETCKNTMEDEDE